MHLIRGLLALTLALGACAERGLAPEEPCTRTVEPERWAAIGRDEVDILLVVDNSNSMAEEQAQLAIALPRLVRALASGDLAEDGTRDFEPVRSIHAGVVTTDMGTAGYPLPTCDRGTFGTRFGDDGILSTRGRTALPGCVASYPSVFELRAGTGDAQAFADDLACVATTGTGGCGFEQQLEATLKALSPSTAQAWTAPGYEPPVFLEGTMGHGDRENLGLVRASSVLAVVLVTDEEDCSIAIPEVFDMASTEYPGDLNLRCFEHPEVRHAIARYVAGESGHAGLLGLRARPRDLVFAAVVGVPPEAIGPSCDEILEHPALIEQIEPGEPPTSPRLRPSCATSNGVAFAPRRIVETACELERRGALVTVQSICQESYDGPIDAIASEIARAMDRACLSLDAEVRSDGLADCALYEVQPRGDVECEALGARVDAGIVVVDGEPRTLCEIVQVSPGSDELGWFLERAAETPDGSDVREICGDEGRRIRINGARTVGGELRFECTRSEGECR